MATYTVTDGQNQTLNIVSAPQSQFDYGSNTVNASGSAALTVTFGGQANNTINLASGARLTTTIASSAIGTTTISGDATAVLIAAGASELSGSDTTFNTAIDGTGTFHATSTRMDVFGPVGAGVTFLGGHDARVFLEHPDTFKGAVQLDNAFFEARGLDRPADYTYVDGALTIYGGGDDHQLASFRLTDATPDTPLLFAVSASGAVDVREGTALLGGETVLAQHVTPKPPVVTNPPATDPTQPTVTQPAVNPPVLISDGTTGQPVTTVAAQPYAGPVAGIAQQVITVTAQNLNILATAPNLFIHTGSGTDAIQAAGGTNVLDGGTGSNFLTAGTGTDTFFVDARGATADTWSTVAKFHAGDAATLWGVSAATAGQWADGQGAAGATGLTLHAGAAGGPTASITLAGFTTADLRNGKLAASFGRDAASGSDYLYVRAG